MAKISKSLASRGLGHVPFDPAHLPTGQWDLVRVFNRASPVSEVIVAAHEPGEDGDEVPVRPSTGTHESYWRRSAILSVGTDVEEHVNTVHAETTRQRLSARLGERLETS
jgi:hypothetical protein